MYLADRDTLSYAPDADVLKRPTPEALWYRINACERAASLLLGLPAGDLDNSFASEEAMKRDTQMERLEKIHVVITGRIIERNASKSSSQAYAITQSIDCELELAATSMGTDWWVEPDLEVTDESGHKLGEMLRLMLQIRHFDRLMAHCFISHRENMEYVFQLGAVPPKSGERGGGCGRQPSSKGGVMVRGHGETNEPKRNGWLPRYLGTRVCGVERCNRLAAVGLGTPSAHVYCLFCCNSGKPS